MSETASAIAPSESVLPTLLKPGSSLHPTILLILDGAFVTLLCIFLSLLYLSSGSIHIVVLITIELALWASVKWFVNELKSVQSQGQTSIETKLEDEAISDKKTQ